MNCLLVPNSEQEMSFKQLFISFLFDSSTFILRPQSTWLAHANFSYMPHFFLLRQQKDKSFQTKAFC